MRTDGETDMNLGVTFCNLATAPKIHSRQNILNMRTSSCNVLFLSDFNQIGIFSTDFSKNFTKIRPVVGLLFPADRRTHMARSVDAFCYFFFRTHLKTPQIRHLALSKYKQMYRKQFSGTGKIIRYA
jgi:hypothetical protein